MTIILLALLAICGLFLSFKMSRDIRFATGIILTTFFLNYFWNRRGALFSIGSTEFFWFETLGILVSIALLFRIKKGGYGLLRTAYFKWILLYVFVELTVSIYTVYNNGISSLAEYKPNYTSTMVLVLFSTYSIENEDLLAIFRQVVYYAAATLLFIPLRVLGIIDMPVYVQNALNWEAVRYIVNYQSLYLVFFCVGTLILFLKKKISINMGLFVLLFLSISAILAIPQRMVWVIFIILLFSTIINQGKKGRKYVLFAILVAVFGTTIILLKDSVLGTQSITAILNPIESFEDSTGYFRLLDFAASINSIFEKNVFFTGFGIMYIPERQINGMYVNLPIHNIFITKFVNGGIFFLVSYLMLWIYPLFKITSLKNSNIDIVNIKIIRLVIFSCLLMSNTTYGGLQDFLPLSIAAAIIISSKNENKNSLNSQTLSDALPATIKT